MLVLHGFWSPERGLCVWAVQFAEHVRQLRTTHKRKRAFMAALDAVSIPDREGRRARRRR